MRIAAAYGSALDVCSSFLYYTKYKEVNALKPMPVFRVSCRFLDKKQ
jgi:hypothetical protein